MGIETIAMIGGGLAAAGGALARGRAAQDAANYNSAVDLQRAAGERDSAAAETQDYIRKGSDTEASQVAAQGATGVTGSGSPLMVDAATVRQVALGAARTLQGGEVRANRLQDDATLQRMNGRNARTASYFDAATSLLTAGGRAAGGGYGSRGRATV